MAATVAAEASIIRQKHKDKRCGHILQSPLFLLAGSAFIPALATSAIGEAGTSGGYGRNVLHHPLCGRALRQGLW